MAAAVHWSDSPPLSYTHPMCLLLATLTQEREGEAGAEGEEWEESDMLCARMTCIKQKRGQKVWLYVTHSHEDPRNLQKKEIIIYSQIFLFFVCLLLPSFASCFTR